MADIRFEPGTGQWRGMVIAKVEGDDGAEIVLALTADNARMLTGDLFKAWSKAQAANLTDAEFRRYGL